MSPDTIDWSQLVPQDYQYDPETETILSSNRLKDGMRVLIVSDVNRVDLERLKMISPIHRKHTMESALKNNRWCVVSNIHYFADQVSFTATYDDGTVLVRTLPQYSSWVVKNDSLPEPITKKRDLVGKIVHDAMLSQHKATLAGDPTKVVKIHDVTDEILRVLGLT